MGAWGSGTFENDAASDFLLEYEAAGAKAVADALAAGRQPPRLNREARRRMAKLAGKRRLA